MHRKSKCFCKRVKFPFTKNIYSWSYVSPLILQCFFQVSKYNVFLNIQSLLLHCEGCSPLGTVLVRQLPLKPLELNDQFQHLVTGERMSWGLFFGSSLTPPTSQKICSEILLLHFKGLAILYDALLFLFYIYHLPFMPHIRHIVACSLLLSH